MAESNFIGYSLSGRYKIEALLGQGGMSAVYKATDPNLRRTVAIKLIHSHLSSDSNFLHRFEEEAAVVAALRHPYIVQVFDFNSDGDTHYMVLEFVPGETLQDRLIRLSGLGERLHFDVAIRYTLNICDALGYAHQRGMIHRDIKPANIMLTNEGQAILMDFGIVKILGSLSHTVTGTIIGTASYIPPEIVKSEPADQRSDIYSLGITLYEMLSGRVPFLSDSTISLMMMHLNNPVPDPRLLRPDLPEPLVNIIYKCLEKESINRYQNVGELSVDLKQVLAGLEFASANNTDVFPLRRIEVASESAALAASSKQATPALVTPTAAVLEPTSSRKNSSFPWIWAIGTALSLVVILAISGVLITWRSQSMQVALPVTATQASAQATQSFEAKPTAAFTNTLPATTIAFTSTPPDDSVAYGPTKVVMPGMIASPTSGQNLKNSPAPYSAQITGISLVANKYVVQYILNGFVPKLPGGFHEHFFFNNVAPEDAGMPGAGPWKMYGGPVPFTGYSASQRPEGVTQMCVIVANSDHTVIMGSGNCFDLP